jgi:hypothetical protein
MNLFKKFIGALDDEEGRVKLRLEYVAESVRDGDIWVLS